MNAAQTAIVAAHQAGTCTEARSCSCSTDMLAAADQESRVASIDFEKVECDRCSGTGRMPFAAYGGVCFKCGGFGRVMTRKGATAWKRVQEVKAEMLTVPVTDVKVGDKVAELGVITEVRVGLGRDEALRVCSSFTEGSEGTITLVGKKSSMSYPINPKGDWKPTAKLGWSQEALKVAAARVAKLSGATVVWA